MNIYHPKISWKNRRNAFIGIWLEKYDFKVSLLRNKIIFKTGKEAKEFYDYQIDKMSDYNDSSLISLELDGNKIRIKVEKVDTIH